MDWKILESLVHEHAQKLDAEKVQALSSELLTSVSEGTKPLHAAKVAYVCALLQLKLHEPDENKAEQFVQYLENILEHETHETSVSEDEHASAHLVYIRKLAEQYYHHLLLVAEMVGAKKLMKHIHSRRQKNHDELLKIQNPLHSFWRKEQKLITRAILKHYVFAGFLLSVAMYFSWTTFWELSDFAMAQWIYTEYTADSLSFLIREGLLLVFSCAFIWAFVNYQGREEAE